MNELPKNNAQKTTLIWIALGFLALTFMMALGNQKPTSKLIPFNEFISKVENGEVSSVTFAGPDIFGKFKAKEGSKVEEDFRSYGDTSSDLFLTKLLNNKIVPNYSPIDRSGENWMNLLSGLLPILFIVGIFVFIARGVKNQQNGMNKIGTVTVTNLQNSTNVKFSDVAGMDEAKEELTEIVDFLKNPSKYTNLGGKIPKGALLIGPPGTGKTMIAKATANEAGVPFLSISGSDFVEMFVGVGASRVRDLFTQARKLAPSIIFIDEIDSVAKQRSSGQFGSHQELEQTLNQLLVEMDGIDEKNKQIIVLAATNRPDSLDAAVLRPGRFDRRVNISLPDIKGREQILKSHAKGKKIASEVNFEKLAKGTAGMSGADLENLLNESAIMSARKNKPEITTEMIEEAKDKILMGTERRSILINPEEKKKTAYHETGHAMVSKLLKLHTVHKVTVIPRGRALGVTQITPDDDQLSFSKKKATDYICMLMGGRAAEDVVYQEFTTGASDDIRRATDIARKMVTEWGMSSNFGPMNLTQQGSTLEGSTVSAQTRSEVDAEVKSILNTCYAATKKLLEDNRDALNKITDLLVEKETISGEEINQFLVNPTSPV